jgi:hypothetical protein
MTAPETLPTPPKALGAAAGKESRWKWPWVVGGVVALFFIIGIATSGNTALPSNATPEQKLAAAVSSSLGDSNRNIAQVSRARIDNDNTVEVHWSINDNLTAGLRKDGAHEDVIKVIKAVKGTAGVSASRLLVVGDFAVPDGYGHYIERPVIDATYSADTLAKINPDGITMDQILRVADSAQVNPEFQ